MIDRLAGLPAAVRHQPIAGAQPDLFGNTRGCQEQAAGQFAVVVGQVGDGCDVADRKDEDVSGSLWRAIVKGKHLLVAVDDRSGELAPDDPAEDAR